MVVFAIAAAAVLYVLFVYPVLLRFAAKAWAQPVRKEDFLPTLTFIIPAYNGEQYLAAKLRSVLALNYPAERREILVVSDGSTDRTDSIAQTFEEVRLIRVPRGGKPAALNASIPTATGEILVLTDVRQDLAANSVRKLVSNFADERVGVVSGELIIRSGAGRDEAEIGLYWRFETWMRDQLSAIDSMFGATGPFYAIRRSLTVEVPPDMLLDDVYLPLTVYFRGYRLVMESAAKAYDIPTSRGTEFNRKVRTLAGNYQILKAFPALLNPFSNRMWWHFVSYKLGRLLLPWGLLAMLVSSAFFPGPWHWWLLGAQLGGYALAALDRYIPAGFPLKKLSSPLCTFCTMMLAAVLGLKVFFVPPRTLWKVTSESRASQQS